jgi:glycosyltransferase involved in cell wall biosynthesis
MSAPDVTIVIPTVGDRPLLLARAIASSRARGFSIEVLIVLNGEKHDISIDLPNREELLEVKLARIESCGVSRARNYGISKASGKLIRFLDDDDYLVEENATEQYKIAFNTRATIVSGKIRIEDAKGNIYGESIALTAQDPYCAILCAKMVVIPLAHVYNLEAIKSKRWNDEISNAEDVEWLHSVSQQQDVKWLILDKVVGVWYQHNQRGRLSHTAINNQATTISAESILRTYRYLKSLNLLTPERTSSTAKGLWECAHKAFYLSPIYWSGIVRTSMEIDKSIPDQYNAYRLGRHLLINPLFIDWIMIPKRFANHFFRHARNAILKTSHIRRF